MNFDNAIVSNATALQVCSTGEEETAVNTTATHDNYNLFYKV